MAEKVVVRPEDLHTGPGVGLNKSEAKNTTTDPRTKEEDGMYWNSYRPYRTTTHYQSSGDGGTSSRGGSGKDYASNTEIGAYTVGVTYPSGSETCIAVPDGKGTVETFMGWHKITSKTSQQYKMKADARGTGRAKDSTTYQDLNNVSLVDGRLLIATLTDIGGSGGLHVEIGDHLNVYFSDGSMWECIQGDVKRPLASEGSDGVWGHNNGASVVEIIYTDYSGDTLSKGNKKKKVSKICKTGNNYFRATVVEPTHTNHKGTGKQVALDLLFNGKNPTKEEADAAMRTFNITNQGKTFSVTAHHMLVDEIKAICQEIDAIGFEIHDIKCYSYRNATDKSTLSMHALGAAIDINQSWNPYNKPPVVPCKYVNHKYYNGKIAPIFTKYDWKWLVPKSAYSLGTANTISDYMHFSISGN